MFLLTAATDLEMSPFLSACRQEHVPHLVTGIGPVETAVRLTTMLCTGASGIHGVINFGVAGAYVHKQPEITPNLLDICLAEQEVLGDLGICLDTGIDPVAAGDMCPPRVFSLDSLLLLEAGRVLTANRISFFSGTFVTVNCASGTEKRGRMLADQHQGLCENMEGAAIARVCHEFGLPFLELRCISNLVEDRDTGRWQLRQACRRAGEVAALVHDHLVKSRSRTEGGQL